MLSRTKTDNNDRWKDVVSRRKGFQVNIADIKRHSICILLSIFRERRAAAGRNRRTVDGRTGRRIGRRTSRRTGRFTDKATSIKLLLDGFRREQTDLDDVEGNELCVRAARQTNTRKATHTERTGERATRRTTERTETCK